MADFFIGFLMLVFTVFCIFYFVFLLLICLDGFFNKSYNKKWSQKLSQLLKTGKVIDIDDCSITFTDNKNTFMVFVGAEICFFKNKSELFSVNNEVIYSDHVRASLFVSLKLSALHRKLRKESRIKSINDIFDNLKK